MRVVSSCLCLCTLLLAPLSVSAAPLTARVHITDDAASEDVSSLLQRKNGDLVIIFTSSREPRGAYASLSKDGGSTWSAPGFVTDAWGDVSLVENRDEQILLVTNLGGKMSVYLSNDAKKWQFFSDIEKVRSNYSPGELMQASDGSYYFTYSSYEEPQPIKSYVYVMRSSDLKTWSAPVRISTGGYSEFDSSILQKSDGSLLVAYNSYPLGGIAFSTSKDGRNWTTPALAVRLAPLAHLGVNLISVKGRPYLFYSHGNASVRSISLRGSRWSKPKNALQNALFGGDAALLKNGKIGFTFSDEDNGNRDVYFDAVKLR